MTVASRMRPAKPVYFLCAPSLAALPVIAFSRGRLTFSKAPTVFALLVAPLCTLLAMIFLVRLARQNRVSSAALSMSLAAVVFTLCLDLYLWWLIEGI